MKDSYDRKIDYMRVSITDRCNLRCRYCMPDGIVPCAHEDILTYDEILAVCREAVSLGIVKFKVTGGEPLVRKDCAKLIKLIYDIDGVEQVTLTTNGVLLKDQLKELMEAGLMAVNISLDTLDREKYREITGFDELDKVMESIFAAFNAGLKVKINAVMHDKNYEQDFANLIAIAEKYPIDVRFIEMMPIGMGAGSYLVSNERLLETLNSMYEHIELDEVSRGNGPAIYYKIPGFKGDIGFISAIHGKFCKYCNRIRLTSRGELKSCLCFDNHISLKEALRKGDRIETNRLLKESILGKPEQHCFEELGSITEKKRMAQIGG